MILINREIALAAMKKAAKEPDFNPFRVLEEQPNVKMDALESPLSLEDCLKIHHRYSTTEFTLEERNAIYDCYAQGINHAGHTWVTWTDVERLLCDLSDVWAEQAKNAEDDLK